MNNGSADVRGAGTRDKPLRTSAWEANLPLHYWSSIIIVFFVVVVVLVMKVSSSFAFKY